MVRILVADFGRKHLRYGDTVSFDVEKEEYLVKRGVAEYVTPSGEASGEPTQITYADKSTLNKMKKEELLAYGEEIGAGISAKMGKDEMVAALLNFIEEQMDAYDGEED